MSDVAGGIRRPVLLAVAGALGLFCLPLEWFVLGAFDGGYSFTGIEVTVFAVCGALTSLGMVGAAAAGVLRPRGAAWLVGYGCALANLAFALIALIATSTVSGLLPAPAGYDVATVESGAGIWVLAASGLLGSIVAGHAALTHPLASSGGQPSVEGLVEVMSPAARPGTRATERSPSSDGGWGVRAAGEEPRREDDDWGVPGPSTGEPADAADDGGGWM
jgi:hypothetical protein